MFLIKQQLTTSKKVHKQSSVTEVFSYNIVLGERPKILLCHQPFFYHLSGRQLSMMHAIITVSEANKAYALANLFSRRKVHLVDYLGCWCFEKPQTYTLDIFSDGLWGWLSKLLWVTSKPKENAFKKYSFLLRNNNFQIVSECFADLEFTKIFIVSTLISMRSFGELLACLLVRASGFMITNSFNIWTRWNVRSPVKDIRWQPLMKRLLLPRMQSFRSVCCRRRITFGDEWLIFEPSDMTLFHWSFIVLVGTSTMVIEIDSQREF